ncbi:MAG: NAD(P)/FAD-dependent oxidoreductase [Novipirellula sp. JB048]
MQIVVIGAGAAGMVAAAEAAKRSAKVLLLEKNTKTGVKILMSGGTRCNITHDTDARGILPGFGHAARFLQPTIGAFPPSEVVRMFANLGVATKVERTGKVFPQSDRALEVRDALQRQAIEAGVEIVREQAVQRLTREPPGWRIETDDQSYTADRVIVTAGGRSWPGCGTTGDGYGWLERLGHTIVATRPALVPLTGGQQWSKALSGITLDDCVVTAENQTSETKKSRQTMTRRSSWLFTHFGFSGPAAMDISRIVTLSEDLSRLRVRLDMVPEVSAEQIDAALRQTAAGAGRRRLSNVLNQWLPSRLATTLADQWCGDPTIAELSKVGRRSIVAAVKNLELPITGTRGFNKAEVTAGGVALNEVNSRTMQSRIAEGLYIAGEVLDVDGWIGGYNVQAAFSTGRAAGIAAATAT